jgi:hypothetical protein
MRALNPALAQNPELAPTPMHRPAFAARPLSLCLVALATLPLAQPQERPPAKPADAPAAAPAQSSFEAELKKLAARWRSARREYDRAIKRGGDPSTLVDPTAEHVASARELALRAAADPMVAEVWTFALDISKGDPKGELYTECLATLRDGAIEERLARLIVEEWRPTLGSDAAESRLAALAERKLDAPAANAVRFALATSLLRPEHVAGAKSNAFAAEGESTPERIARARKLLEDVRAAEKDSALAKRADDMLFAFEHLAIGTTAEDFSTVDENGKPWKLSDYRGKVVVVDFWGYW